MSAMPAEPEPRRPGPGGESSSARALEVKARGTVQAAELPVAQDRAAQDRAAQTSWAEPVEAQTSWAEPAEAQTSWAQAVEAQTPEAEAGEAEILETGAAQSETPEAEAAETAQLRALRTLSPATVRPRQVGLMPSPARRRPRPAGLRPRRVSTRLHPTGVRACSDVLRGQPPAAALPVPQARPSLAGDAPQTLRLTRRGRLVLAVFAAVVVSLIGLAVASGTPAAGSAAPAGTAGHSMTRIVVQPGQTLWTIAMRADPQADPRQVVQQIIAANALRDGSIQAGQRLLVPRG
jgi:LysM domain